MNTRKPLPQMTYSTLPSQQDVTKQKTKESFFLPIGVTIAVSIGLSFVTNAIKAEATETVDIQHYMNSEQSGNTAGKASQNAKESSAIKDTVLKNKIQGEEATNSSQGGSTGNTKQATENPSAEKPVDKTTETNQTKAVDMNPNNQQMPITNDTKAETPGSTEQAYQMDATTDPVSKPADGKGKLPTFTQADVNSDHYITKVELKNFPYLLQVFDKIDAGNDGKLEQHEYQSLKMETKREGEIR